MFDTFKKILVAIGINKNATPKYIAKAKHPCFISILHCACGSIGSL